MILKSNIAAPAPLGVSDNWEAEESSIRYNQIVAYSKVASSAHRKSLGQFFTPPRIAALMADWVTSKEAKSILDPAFGTGVLIQACIDTGSLASYTAFEKDGLVLSHVPKGLKGRVDIHNEDFLTHSFENKFDGLVMNPPYIRHREINGYEVERQEISLLAQCAIPKSANLYIYFVVKAISVLKDGGRAAILIPGEWMSANFSATFKKYLVGSGVLKEVVLFSNCSKVFDGALTTASILLIEK